MNGLEIIEGTFKEIIENKSAALLFPDKRPLSTYRLWCRITTAEVSKWMGHAKMETTAIYCNAVGEEQQTIAARMWT
jgi:hypothetical protein